MTEHQNDRALLKYNLSRYFDLFVAAIEDKEKTGDVERDIEFKAILQAIDDLSYNKFEQTSFRLTFSFYTFYINRSELPGEPEQRPNKVIHITDSHSSRMACTLRTRTHLKVLGIEPPQDEATFRIYTFEAVKADARDQIAKYLSTIPIIKADPQKRGGTTANDPQDATQKQGEEQTPNEIYYDMGRGVLFAGGNSETLTPTEKAFFEHFWDKETVEVEDMINYMTTFTELKNTIWDRRYFGKTLSAVNGKGKSLGVKKLIKNVERYSKMYRLSVKVKKKTFKS